MEDGYLWEDVVLVHIKGGNGPKLLSCVVLIGIRHRSQRLSRGTLLPQQDGGEFYSALYLARVEKRC